MTVLEVVTILVVVGIPFMAVSALRAVFLRYALKIEWSQAFLLAPGHVLGWVVRVFLFLVSLMFLLVTLGRWSMR